MVQTKQKKIQLQVGPDTVRMLDLGHPWVLADRFTKAWPRVASGSLADLVDKEGRFLGTALIDPDSRIVARVLSRAHVRIDQDFLSKRFREAVNDLQLIEF